MLKILASFLGPIGPFILSLIGTVAPALAASIGETYIKAKQTQAAREGKQDEAGAGLAGSWIVGVTEANRVRADARAKEGAWGPMGIITFLIGMAFAYHVWMIVLDSTPWSLFGLLTPHRVGSWGVAALPGRFHDVELAVLQALFYVAPPAVAAIAVAKAFRR